jgi:hypothetical protein
VNGDVNIALSLAQTLLHVLIDINDMCIHFHGIKLLRFGSDVLLTMSKTGVDLDEASV